MLKPFRDIASIGIVKDTDPRNLPDNAWTDGENVRTIRPVCLYQCNKVN